MKIPFSSWADASYTFEPPEPERARTSAGSRAVSVSTTGFALRLRYAASTRRTRADASGDPDIRTFHWRYRASGACTSKAWEPPVQPDHALHVVSGVADSPDRKANSTFAPAGVSPSQRKAPNLLVRAVSFTAETYSPTAGPLPGR